MAGRAVLAYSGGLDTSVSVRWMRDEWGVDVIALAVDVGQGDDLERARQRALLSGAADAIVVDARREFARDFVAPAIRGNALYEGKYPLVSALSRPLIARHLVRVARETGAAAVAHGCTGKGNDQVRFEVSVRALAPDLDVLAPVREWGLSRADAIEYAAEHEIPVAATRESPYSVDANLWGRTVECGVLENPWTPAPDDVFELTRVPSPPPEPTEMVVAFESGVPVALDGRRLELDELISATAERVGPFGWGRVDMVENRRVGIKSREIYEVPAALALLLAHADLESITLERDLMREKARLEPRYAELVYDGLWYSPLREALDAFFAVSQRHVTGEVRLALAPGSCAAVGRRAERALYDPALATYEGHDQFRHQDAAGFVRLWGLGLETWARRQGSDSDGSD